MKGKSDYRKEGPENNKPTSQCDCRNEIKRVLPKRLDSPQNEENSFGQIY